MSDTEKRKNYDEQRRILKQTFSQENLHVNHFSSHHSYSEQQKFHARTVSRTKSKSENEIPSLDASIQIYISLEEAHLGCSKKITFEKKHNSKLKNTQLIVQIPKGIQEGKRLRLKEQSHQFKSKKGDLFIEIKFRKHPLFRRKKNDLLMQLPLSATDAILGKKMAIPTLTGEAHIHIKPPTYSGKQLKLKNQGFYSEDGQSRGDFILEIKIDIPNQITDEDKKWFKEFKKKEALPPSVAQFNIQARKLFIQRAS